MQPTVDRKKISKRSRRRDEQIAKSIAFIDEQGAVPLSKGSVHRRSRVYTFFTCAYHEYEWLFFISAISRA